MLRYTVSKIADHDVSPLERPASVWGRVVSGTLTEASFPSPELPKAGRF